MFHLFFNLISRLEMFVLKILIYYFVMIPFIVIWRKQNIYSMKAIQKNSHIIKSSCILSILSVIDLSLILFNTTCGIYSIAKESKYTAVFVLLINKTQCVSLLCLSSRFMTYAPSFLLGKLILQKPLLNLGCWLK